MLCLEAVTVPGFGSVVGDCPLLPKQGARGLWSLKFESCRNLKLTFRPFGDFVVTASSFDQELSLKCQEISGT
jgi:hypothetical protein